MRMTAEAYRQMIAAKPKRGNKYRAVPAFRCARCAAFMDDWKECPACGGKRVLRFDSGREARCYDDLHRRAVMGLIFDLKLQVPFEIVIAGQKIARYVADFTYVDGQGEKHVIDVKGHDTRMSKLKRKAVEAAYGITVEVVH